MKTLIVFDVEGTIFKAEYRIDSTEYASTIWQPIARSLGAAAVEEERQTHEKWEKGEYKTYSDWVADTYQIHKKYSLRKDVFEKIIKEAEYKNGVKDFFANLQREKYIPVFISGGFNELVKRAKAELMVEDGQGACEYYFDPDDNYLASCTIIECDFKGKYRYLKTIFSKYNIDPNSKWIYVGDGKNDVDIAKRAPVSFAINAHEDLKKVSTHCVKSFSQIATIINGSTENVPRKIIDKKLILVTENDYKTTPKCLLGTLLDTYKVVFVGLQKEYSLFKSLKSIHKNLIVISAEEYQTKFKQFTDVDIAFIFIGCIGHGLGNKAEQEINTPIIVHLKNFRNLELVTTQLTNIIHKELVLPSEQQKVPGDKN